MSELSIDVIIPSVGRPDDARAAIRSVAEALALTEPGQVRANIMVVHRQDDSATQTVAIESGARAVRVSRPGLAWAMRAGAEASMADIVAFMDDDARMRPGWFSKAAQHYADPRIGGVGGADIQPDGFPVRVRQSRIGTIDRWGRVLGGHHQAEGHWRLVDHLKGANCSFRRELFLAHHYQDRVAGGGAQARNEFIASLAIKEQKFALLLDPEMIVDHYPAPRSSDDARSSVSKAYETAFNECFAFAVVCHRRRLMNRGFLLLLGYQNTPGLVRLVIGRAPLRQVVATFRGVISGWSVGRRHRKRKSAVWGNQ
ncbi:glycosyltransferase [Microbacterium sp. PRF11]|uniref:glycosyltransferase n=1 Tax=Microbacterium sp. PRF11 TaxID=2962593 RepID=UPI0037C9840B